MNRDLGSTFAWDTSFTVKSFDEEQRIIEGIASTPSADRTGDIVDPKGAVFKLPLSFLWQHDAKMPLGRVIEAKVTDAGIWIKAKIEKDLAPYIEEKWPLIRAGLVNSLSIGFRSLEAEPIKDSKTFGVRFKQWEWLELSAVTIPANQDASILSIKALDYGHQRAALGTASNVVRLGTLSPGASGKNAGMALEGHQVKTTAEREIEFQNMRGAIVGRMTARMEKCNEEGRTMDSAEQEEHDQDGVKVKDIDGHLKRLGEVSILNVQKATPITAQAGASQQAGSEARGGSIISVTPNRPQAYDFARYLLCLGKARGDLMLANQIAQSECQDRPRIVNSMKAAVAAGTTTDTDWAKPLVEYTTMTNEFIEFFRPQTIIGRLTQLRRVPFNIRVASQTQGSTVGWVGEGMSKPVSELKFAEVLIGWAKAAGIVVITKELAKLSTPQAEGLIRDDLAKSMRQFLDQQFIDPAVAAVANVHPASVTNGVTAIPSSGSTIEDIIADMQTLFGNLTLGHVSPTPGGAWVTTPAIAIALSMAINVQGGPAYPTMTPNGGTFMGYPVIVSESVPTALMIFIAQPEVYLSEEDGIEIDVSEQASVQMDSAPATPATPLVSFWQQNLIGIRAEHFINWQKRNPAAVQVITAFAPSPTTAARSGSTPPTRQPAAQRPSAAA